MSKIVKKITFWKKKDLIRYWLMSEKFGGKALEVDYLEYNYMFMKVTIAKTG